MDCGSTLGTHILINNSHTLAHGETIHLGLGVELYVQIFKSDQVSPSNIPTRPQWLLELNDFEYSPQTLVELGVEGLAVSISISHSSTHFSSF